uniref:Uncharacterized protein n=1 Tax=Arundo donax TaxID=35708 RepID=A0A0A9C3T3_ARUDO
MIEARVEKLVDGSESGKDKPSDHAQSTAGSLMLVVLGGTL